MSVRRIAVIVAVVVTGLASLGMTSGCTDGTTGVSSSTTAVAGDRLLLEEPRWELFKAFDLRSDVRQRKRRRVFRRRFNDLREYGLRAVSAARR